MERFCRLVSKCTQCLAWGEDIGFWELINCHMHPQIIPALERVLSLVGADVQAWFAAMPRPTRMAPQKRPAGSLALPQQAPGAGMPFGQQRGAYGAATTTIDQYYLSRHCAVCDELTTAAQPLCDRCKSTPQAAVAVLWSRIAKLQRQHTHLVRICLTCGGGGGRNLEDGGVVCDSLDCGLYFERRKVLQEQNALAVLAEVGLETFDS